MSRLEELIGELCPDGMEYKRLEECCYLEKGKTPIQKAIPGEYPLVTTTEERKSSNEYQFDAPAVCVPLISSRGHGVASLNQVYYQEGKFALGNILCGVTPKNRKELSASFLHQYLNYKKDTLIVPLMKGGANVSLTVDSLKSVKIPVPPMEVQREIAQILGRFIALSEELKRELTARRTQYNYYRDKILRFDIPEETDSVEWKNLGEVANISRGVRVVRSQLNAEGGYPVFQNSMTPLGYHKERNCPANTTFIISAGAAGEIGYSRTDFWAADDCLYVKCPDDLHSRYVYYALLCQQQYIYSRVRRSSVPRLSRSVVENIAIPIPPLPVQQHIVAILDRFDTLCNSPTSGLPAEIKARRKQYEYYRDRLLSFPEKSS